MTKVCLITGASGGIGAAIAYKMAAQGFSLYLHFNRNEEKAREVAFYCETEFGVKTKLLQADLSKKNSVERLLNGIEEDVDVLIHNSGNSYYGLITDMEDTEIEEMTQLHLISPMLLTKKLLPKMVNKKSGSIIVVSSIWGLTGAACEVVYSTVKGGLNSFVKALAKEVAPSNIRVNGVAPGAIATKMMDNFNCDDQALLCEEIPFGRLGEASEVANVVSFLSSREASYISGQIISVNGAWYC